MEIISVLDKKIFGGVGVGEYDWREFKRQFGLFWEKTLMLGKIEGGRIRG